MKHRSLHPTLAVALLALATSPGCTELPRTYSTWSGELLFEDSFDEGLGSHWKATGPGATVKGGALVVEGLRNHPLWLDRPLPRDVRIQFDAWAESDEGDIKVELAGDGESYTTSDNYIASGYVVIFGGWNNSTHKIVRRNEHGRAGATKDGPPLVPGRRYRIELTRQGGEIRWNVDGREWLTYTDNRPLDDDDHRFFAFSGWESRVRFDNLRIEGL